LRCEVLELPTAPPQMHSLCQPMQHSFSWMRGRGFVLETPASLGSDRTLSLQIALHGNYEVEGSARLAALPETGSLIIVAPGKNSNATESPVRVLAMVG
jgi:hypothetical protein